jgi:glycosyltransferase involved in cell wall biosynthesis
MHILFVNHAPIPVFAYGGTERVIWDLGKSLVRLGHRVSYLVPQGSHCDFAQVLAIREGVDWAEQIPADVDLVHFQFNPPDLATLERPYLMTQHGNSPEHAPLPLNTVFVSRNHAERHGSTEFVYNGLDWEAYGPVDFERPRPYCHFLGKAAWRVKNVQGAIDVAGDAGVDLMVLGGTRLNIKRGFRFTWSRRVSFAGMVGGQVKLDLLQGSRGLIFPVLWHEPFGLAVIESLYFGCPVYATPYGALPELVPRNVRGAVGQPWRTGRGGASGRLRCPRLPRAGDTTFQRSRHGRRLSADLPAHSGRRNPARHAAGHDGQCQGAALAALTAPGRASRDGQRLRTPSAAA